MSDYASLYRMAALTQAILNAIEKHEITDDESRDVLTQMAATLHDGDSDWASELIYDANELNKDGRER